MTRRHIWWCAASLIALCAGVFLYHLGGLALFEPDEGRNAEIAREIVLLKDWVTPHYDFVPYLDKPMLFYWLEAAAFTVCGASEWAARLPSTLAAGGCVLLVFDLARGRWGVSAALWSALILATSPLFVAFARISIFDMTLTFFVTLAVWAFARGADDRRGRRGRWIVVMCAATALAVLTKGPIGALLPGLVVIVWAALTKHWWIVRGRALAVGIGVFVLIAVPWYVWAELRNPGYLHYFLVEENLLRYVTPRFRKYEPWYFYLIVVSLGAFPWTALVYPLVRRLKAVVTDEQTRLLVIWTIVPIAFFSVSSSKLPGYVLPSVPPLALLLGSTAARLFESDAPRSRWVVALPALATLGALSVIVLVLFFPGLVPANLSTDSASVIEGVRQQAGLQLVFLLALPCVGVIASLFATPRTCFVVACAGCAIVYGLAINAAGPVAERRSSRRLAAQATPLIRPDDQLVVYDAYFSSLPFYLRVDRPIWNVWLDRGDEIMGSPYVREVRPAPARGARDVVMDPAGFSAAWSQPAARLLVFVDADRADRFARERVVPPVVLLRAGDAVVMANR